VVFLPVEVRGGVGGSHLSTDHLTHDNLLAGTVSCLCVSTFLC